MRLPRGGLPGVDSEALLLVRVPINGPSDSGRRFWLRLDKDAKEVGFKASNIFPSCYYIPDPDGTGDCVALVTTHADDLLIAHTDCLGSLKWVLWNRTTLDIVENNSHKTAATPPTTLVITPGKSDPSASRTAVKMPTLWTRMR